MFIKMLSHTIAELSLKNKKINENYVGFMILVQDRSYWHIVIMHEYF